MEITVVYLKILICENRCIYWKGVMWRNSQDSILKELGSSENRMYCSDFALWPRMGQRRWQALRQLCDKVTWLHRRHPGTQCRDFQCWHLENSGWEKFKKSSAVFCLLIWQTLCVLDFCEVPCVCDCSPLCCLPWHLVTWKEVFFHTAKGSSSTEARLIWKRSAQSACAGIKFSWRFRSGLQLFVWTL